MPVFSIPIAVQSTIGLRQTFKASKDFDGNNLWRRKEHTPVQSNGIAIDKRISFRYIGMDKKIRNENQPSKVSSRSHLFLPQ
jgi:hypothetical protein